MFFCPILNLKIRKYNHCKLKADLNAYSMFSCSYEVYGNEI